MSNASTMGSGGSTGTPKKKSGGGSPIPVAPSKPSSGTSTYHAPAGSSGSGGKAGHDGKAGRGGKGGDGGASGAEKRAIARENESKRKAANRYREQAANLEAQARALRHALKIDFRHALRQKLSNVNEVLGDQNAALMEGYRQRVHSLRGAVQDNEKAAAGQTSINTANRLRERDSAVGEAMAQGAGESDLLRSQMMSLRNWSANQSEVQRSFFDTLRSVNSSLTDLNVDTKTAKINNQIQANADKEQLWTNYYNQRSEAFTQLGNTLGQQADYYSMAKEMGGSAKGMKGAKKGAAAAFMGAAKESGKAWDNPGISKSLARWQGQGEFGTDNSGDMSHLQQAQVTRLDKRPEGATLRKW